MSCTWDIGDRCNGKTTRLIQRAGAENLYIIVSNRTRALHIAKMARDMGIDILFPITLQELPFKMRGNAYCMTHDGVLVDDVEDILSQIIGMPAIGAAAHGKVVSE